MQLVGGTLALAGVAARWPAARIRPRRSCPTTSSPTDVIAGHAAALRLGADARRRTPRRVLATAWEGRPTKIEGNPEHPITKGVDVDRSTRPTILSLYDDTTAPARSSSTATGAAGSSSASTIERAPRRPQGRRRRQAGVPRRAVVVAAARLAAEAHRRRLPEGALVRAHAARARRGLRRRAHRLRPAARDAARSRRRPRSSSRSTPTSSAAGRCGSRRSASGPSVARPAPT